MSLADAAARYFADRPAPAALALAALVLVGSWLAVALWGSAAHLTAWAVRGAARRWPRLAYLGELVDGPPIPETPDVRQAQLDHLTLTLVEADLGLIRGRHSGLWWTSTGPLPERSSRNLDDLVERGWVETTPAATGRDVVLDWGREPRTAALTEAGVRALHALACDDPAAHIELVYGDPNSPEALARPDTTRA